MPLRCAVANVRGRPVLTINGEPTTETWAYGWPNAMPDFAAAGLRICQFHVAAQPWWLAEGRYDFAPIEAQINDFLAAAPGALLIPRVCFGYRGEGWWARANAAELSAARTPAGDTPARADGGTLEVDVPQSAASRRWERDAGRAMGDFVRHFESRYGENILGYHVGAGVSVEWFRWWTYVDGAYEDYSEAAAAAFREFLASVYADDEAIRRAWGRADVTLERAQVPAPERLHSPKLGFLRDLPGERDVIDWWHCLSRLNARQVIALCRAAKQACEGRKIVGVLYGYTFPHWNNQNPARSGHLGLRELLACEAIDYIASPYHYDNRGPHGFHNSQTVPGAIERAGKLHLDETDTHTLRDPPDDGLMLRLGAATTGQAVNMLRRDAAAVLGTAGNLWWMDLRHARWFRDPAIIDELRGLNELSRMTLDMSRESHAQAALVIDDRSYACCDVNSNLNLYYSSLPRQFEWSDLGFPFETVLLSELEPGGALADRHFRLYVFLNAWRVEAAVRPALLERTRRRGVSSVWFHAAGFYDGDRGAAENIGKLTGMRVRMQTTPVLPEVELLEQCSTARFGARLSAERAARTVVENPRGWDTPTAPVFAIEDEAATPLGRYAHDGSVGMARLERDGWRSFWCGAPMLPGGLLRRIAADAGVHLYAPQGCVVHHRGPLLSVYAPRGAQGGLCSPPGAALRSLEYDPGARRWKPLGDAGASQVELRLGPEETGFFVTSP